MFDDLKSKLESYVTSIARTGAERAAKQREAEIKKIAEAEAKDIILTRTVAAASMSMLGLTLSIFAFAKARRPKTDPQLRQRK